MEESEPLYAEVPVGFSKWPSQYNTCPSCGKIKFKRSKLCQKCRKLFRPIIQQPDDPSIRFIPLTQSQVATVDTADYKWLNQHKWYATQDRYTGAYYAWRKELVGQKWVHISMHDAILGIPPGSKLQGDHIQVGDTLNNRRSNLRIATKSQNCMNRRIYRNNTSGFTGIYHSKINGTYTAYIGVANKHFYLGAFKSLDAAIEARKNGAAKYHGEFARS
jgi:hypothetical protein